MLKDLLNNPRALLFAVLVHVVLVLLLVVSLQWVQPPPKLQGSENIVQAVVIDESKTREAQERAREEERRKQAETEAQRRAAEQERQRAREAEQRKAEEAERQRQQEAERRRRGQIEVERALAERQRAQEQRAQEQKRLAEQEAKRKLEAEQRREAEAKRQAEAEARRKAEEAAKRKAEAEAKRKAEEDARRKADEARRQQEAEAALQRELAAEQQSREAQSLVAKYVPIIQQKVARNWRRPPSARAGMSCEVFVRLIPGGEVVEARVVKSSGDVMFDRSVETAVVKASPLPIPADPAMFERFRELRFVFKPEG